MFAKIILFFFTGAILYAQNIDSLSVEYKGFHIEVDSSISVNDENRLENLIKKGDYFFKLNLNESEKNYRKGLILVGKEDLSKRAYLLRKLGDISIVKGDFSESFTYHTESKKNYETLKDTANIAYQQHEISRVYKFLKDYDKAIESNKIALALARQIKNEELIGRSYNIMGNIYNYSDNDKPDDNKIDSALVNYKKAKFFFEKINDRFKLTAANNNLAIIYSKQKLFDKAIQIRLNNLDFIKKYKSKNALSINYHNLASTYYKIKDYKASLKYLDSSENISEAEGLKFMLSRTKKLRSDIYYEKKEFKKAYESYVLHKSYSDTVFNNKKNKRIKELELKNEFEIVKKQMDHELEKKEVEFKSYLITFFVLLFFILIISYMIWKQNIVKQKIIEADLEKERLKKEVLDERVKVSEAELKMLIADNSMRLEFIKQLSIQLRKDKNNATSQEIKKYITFLINKLKQQIDTENKLSSLQSKIDDVNKGFNLKITELYPSLTKTEREVCFLLRLNLSIKEIAAIRNASVDSIKSLRYRIRKKLSIPKSQELEVFVQNIEF